MRLKPAEFENIFSSSGALFFTFVTAFCCIPSVTMARTKQRRYKSPKNPNTNKVGGYYTNGKKYPIEKRWQVSAVNIMDAGLVTRCIRNCGYNV
jgi:hypothetical protein